jgi:hypothetical protein
VTGPGRRGGSAARPAPAIGRVAVTVVPQRDPLLLAGLDGPFQQLLAGLLTVRAEVDDASASAALTPEAG